MFSRLGHSVTRHPVLVILVWLAVVGGLAAGGFALGTPQAPDNGTAGLPTSAESVRAQRTLDATFPSAKSAATATVVFTRTDGRPLTGADQRRVDAELTDLAGRVRDGRGGEDPRAAVTLAHSGTVSPNRLVQIAGVGFDKVSAEDATTNAVGHLRSQLGDDLAGTSLRARVTGDAAQAKDSVLLGILVSSGMVVAILALLLLLFRSVLVAFTTVFTIAAVGQGVAALLTIGAHVFDYTLDATTTGLLPVVLFGVGTDYVVFLLFRYRERLRHGDDHRTALAAGVGRVGEAVVASALAVAASFAVLLVSQLGSFRVLGPALGIAVLAMLFASLTLMPAVYALLGKRFARSASWRREPTARVSGRAASLVSRRPGAVAAAGIGLLAVGALLVTGYHPSYQPDGYPQGSESAAGYADLRSGFPAGTLSPTHVVVTADGSSVPASTVREVQRAAASVPGVAGAAPGQTSATVSVVDVRLADDPLSERALDTVAAVERAVHAHPVAGASVAVGGATAAYNDVRHVIDHDMRLILPLAGLAIGLVLVLMLRSVLAPVVLMASVGLGFLATTGVAVLVFQHVLGKPGLVFSMPLVVYLFVASIGTDYNILMVGRLREELRAGADPRTAVRTAVREAGPTVAAAGSVLAVSFAILTIGGGQLAEIGFAVAAGALISTFVLAFLLAPALLTLLGRAAWWPSRTAGPGAAARPERELVGATMSTWQR
ncbi:putative drug exporter of the RND superfamily [Jatrophihabitans endophyticus]|uniref:Putative drug exporter of the RND superfamily n=1 Tax=Jatrophihabitans endophyticus TaxID=1206085 RepID=A0A1M5UE73_9ACTN|nr:MMPL family transporter [Jatrophihabitans endophyticus]SHH61211.1 putative drug exporter of the RND superfamily [Jatrophihabitans endophyticus]